VIWTKVVSRITRSQGMTCPLPKRQTWLVLMLPACAICLSFNNFLFTAVVLSRAL
jgi:hypothetical protein